MYIIFIYTIKFYLLIFIKAVLTLHRLADRKTSGDNELLSRKKVVCRPVSLVFEDVYFYSGPDTYIPNYSYIL